MEQLVSNKSQSWLSWFLRGILILGFLVLIGRLIELQIIKGSYFRSLSEGNRIRRVPILAPRGRIIARGGEILVDNKEVRKRVVFNPDKGYEKTDDWQNAPSDEVIVEAQRDYKLGAKFAHVSGYLGEINQEELGKVNPKCFEKGPGKLGSLVGRSGLEQRYECTLSGIDGEELVEVDTTGKKIRILGRRQPVAGKDLLISIDFSLQEKVAGEMVGKKGAVVAMNGKGEILALYSNPSFDPNIFVKKGFQKEIDALLNDPSLPFFNRAIGGLYHPGSVFKPVVAIAALEEGKIDKDYTMTDPGVITIGQYSYSNWYFTQYGRTEGSIGLTRALARSTDTFFYKIGEMAGPEAIARWANKMGLDVKTNIDLPGEVPGLVPTPEWKLKTKGERWFLGNTYHISIGQGDLALTPIEVNRGILAIGAGKICEPKLYGDTSCREANIQIQNLELVREGMIQACSPGGTGYTFFEFKPQVACKTGTAETNLDGKTHAWFSLFSPKEFPDIVMTVLVEGGGEGSKVAGPIARTILDSWYGKGI